MRVRGGMWGVGLAMLAAVTPACGPTGSRSGASAQQPDDSDDDSPDASIDVARPPAKDAAATTDTAAADKAPASDTTGPAPDAGPTPDSAGTATKLDTATPAPDTAMPVDTKVQDTAIDKAPPTPDTPPDTAPTEILTGLVGHWKMDESTGSSLAGDSTANANTGTLMGMNPATDWVDGPPGKGKALTFNGTSHVSVPSSNSLNGITSGVTLSAWVYRTQDKGGWANVVTRQVATTGGEHYALGFSDNKVYILGDTLGQAMDPTPSPNNQWLHIAGTFDGTTGRIYVNGVQVAEVTHPGAPGPDSSSLIIGGNQNDATGAVGETFVGHIDEVRVYNRALNPAEVAELAK